MSPKWDHCGAKTGGRVIFLPPRSFSVDPEYDLVSLQPDVTDIMHRDRQRVISASIPSNLIDCENCASDLPAQKNTQGFRGKHYLSEFKDQQNTLFLSSAENVVLINNVHPAFRYSYDFADS